MSKKIYRLFLVITLLACFMLVNVALAQVVDPCWYGCPKEGCPGCGDGGGPINAKSSKNTAKDCKKTQRLRLKDCRHYYPAKADQAKYNACLAKDKALFDECLKAAK